LSLDEKARRAKALINKKLDEIEVSLLAVETVILSRIKSLVG